MEDKIGGGSLLGIRAHAATPLCWPIGSAECPRLFVHGVVRSKRPRRRRRRRKEAAEEAAEAAAEEEELLLGCI